MMSLILSKALVFAAAVGDPCTLPKQSFLFLPSWWEFMPGKIDPTFQCTPTLSDASGAFHFSYILLIGLAILDILLRIAGFVAVISIIISGFQHQFTMGSADKAAAARRRLYNSLIGLAIALVATALVTFIGNQLTK
jgi:hypothetical protein